MKKRNGPTTEARAKDWYNFFEFGECLLNGGICFGDEDLNDIKGAAWFWRYDRLEARRSQFSTDYEHEDEKKRQLFLSAWTRYGRDFLKKRREGAPPCFGEGIFGRPWEEKTE